MNYIEHLERRIQIQKRRAMQEDLKNRPAQSVKSFERGNHLSDGPNSTKLELGFSPPSMDGTTPMGAGHYGVSKDAQFLLEQIEREHVAYAWRVL